MTTVPRQLPREVELAIHVYTAGVIRSRWIYAAEQSGAQWCTGCRSYRPPFTRCRCRTKTTN